MQFEVPSALEALRSPRMIWVGAVAVAAIVPALVLGGAQSAANRPSSMGDPISTAALPAQSVAQATVPDNAAAQPGAKPIALDRASSVALIRGVLTSVQQANETGNYTVLRDLGSPEFQTANTASRLSEIFAGLRSRNLDLTSAAVTDPEISVAPEVNGDGMLHVAGTVPAVPAPVSFDLTFASAGSRWLPFSISIGLASPAPAVSQAPTDKRVAEQSAPRPSGSPNTVTKQRAMAMPLDATRTQ